jgi:hypothetical protein
MRAKKEIISQTGFPQLIQRQAMKEEFNHTLLTHKFIRPPGLKLIFRLKINLIASLGHWCTCPYTQWVFYTNMLDQSEPWSCFLRY